MKSGATYFLNIVSDMNNDDIEKVDKVIFTLQGNNEMTKNYPSDDVSFNDGLFTIALTQGDTLALAGEKGKIVYIEGQVNYKDKSVTKTETEKVFFGKTLATEEVDGNYPSAFTAAEISMEFMNGVIVAEVKEEAYEKIAEMVADKVDYDAIAEKAVERVDFSEKVEEAKAEIDEKTAQAIASIPFDLHIENNHLTFTV